MTFPKLKHALLCRILTYVVVIGGFGLPIAAVCCTRFLPELVRVAIVFALVVGLLVYLVKNFVLLMGMDMALATLHCNLTARTCYDLPRGRRTQSIQKSISRFGTACAPAPIQPQPLQLRYRRSSSATVYTKGIEKVAAAYETVFLDAEQYHAIFRSAQTNSSRLIGRKQPLFLDKAQKKAPLNRVTVVVILAHKVEPSLWETLYKKVCQQSGDEWEDTIIPCVIDLEKEQCVFNSQRLPYTGFAYPVKNRGIRLIKRLVFGGYMPLKDNLFYVEPIKDANPEDSLWTFWRGLSKELKGSDKAMNKRMAAMKDGQIIWEEDLLYVKWGDRAICQWVKADTAQRNAKVEAITYWSYPKNNPIAKKTIQEIEIAITRYFSNQGYRISFEEDID